jgi:hypothetical protein
VVAVATNPAEHPTVLRTHCAAVALVVAVVAVAAAENIKTQVCANPLRPNVQEKIRIKLYLVTAVKKCSGPVQAALVFTKKFNPAEEDDYIFALCNRPTRRKFFFQVARCDAVLFFC